MIYFLLLAYTLFMTWLFVELVTAKVRHEDETGLHDRSGAASTTEKGNGEQISINPARN